MNYEEVLDFIYHRLPMYQNDGKSAFKKDLSNINELCKLLGEPQNQFKSIHIAGTNGKGSVAHICSAVYQSKGFKTGLYTSPHYKDFRERIKINGQFITEENVIEFVGKIKPHLDNIQASFFEITVAMAFDYFNKENVDIAIIETGLGGRLDSTNIIKPELSIITNIGFDHMDMLGNTLEKIAAEKAGIIKQGIPVCIGKIQSETTEVFNSKADQLNSQLVFAEEIADCKIENGNAQITIESESFEIKTNLEGPYQHENIRTALAGLNQIDLNKDLLNPSNLQTAFADFYNLTSYKGRWMVLRDNNYMLIADSAHNIDGIRVLLDHVKAKMNFNSLRIIYSAVKDKSISEILNLMPQDARYYLTPMQINRSLSSDQLEDLFDEKNLDYQAYTNSSEALRAAEKDAQKDDLLIITGSCFLVGELI